MTDEDDHDNRRILSSSFSFWLSLEIDMNGNCDCNEQILCRVLSGPYNPALLNCLHCNNDRFPFRGSPGRKLLPGAAPPPGSALAPQPQPLPPPPPPKEYFMHFLLIRRLLLRLCGSQIEMTWCEPKCDCIYRCMHKSFNTFVRIKSSWYYLGTEQ